MFISVRLEHAFQRQRRLNRDVSRKEAAMANKSFVPNPKYQIKLLVVNTVIAFLILVGTGILAALIGLDDPNAALTIFLIFTGFDALY